jgi:hypothetical protein
MKVIKISVLNGPEFICSSGEELGIFCENYRKDYPNAMLRILFAEITEEEYKTIPASEESFKYF